VAARLQRSSPLVIFGLIVLAGGAAGLAAAPRAHGLDPFAVMVLGMAAAAVSVTCLVMLEPAWILTGGLMLSVFSGYWRDMGVPIPVDRVVITCGIGAVVVRSLRTRGETRLQVRGVHWLMLLLILYAVGSAAWSGTLTSHGPLFALLDRLGLVPFLLYLVAPAAFRTSHQRRILAVGLLILGAYLGLITLFEAVGLRSLVIPHYILNPAFGIHAERARGPFLEAGANGLAMFVCLVAAALTISWWRDWRMRAAVVGVIVLCTAGLLFTLTRQTWVGASAGAVAAMLVDRRLRGWLPFAAVGAAVIVALSLAFIPGLSQSVSQRASAQGPLWDRLNSDAAALRMVEARPALGFGWGRFGAASVPYYRLAATYPLTSVGDAHNVPLSNASELGLVGLALWLVIVVLGLGAPAMRRAPPEVEPWRIGLIAVVVAWFVQSNFTPFDYAFDNYVIWLWAGVVVAGLARPSPVRRPGVSRALDHAPPSVALSAGV
jgi:putative inorganic carbon (hco3(-)) transporter